MFRQNLFVLLISLSAAPALAAPFVNLDFEQAVVNPPGPNPHFINAAQAFPGWTATIGASVLSSVAYNYPGAGEPVVALYDMASTGLGLPLLQGQYMALTVTGFGQPEFPSALSQQGDVPSFARTLTLLCPGGRPPPAVTHYGQPLSMKFINFTVMYGADVTNYASANVVLRLQADGITSRAVGFDDIRFTSTPLPEPLATSGMFFISLIALGRYSRNSEVN